jgi:hypothetical protein
MFEADRYTPVVTALRSGIHPRPWGWEIYRDGQPLPATGADSRDAVEDLEQEIAEMKAVLGLP